MNPNHRAGSLPASVLTATVVLFCLSLCQGQPTNLVLTEQDNGDTVAAVVQQPILVKLRGNATTGYAWLLTSTNGTSVSATGPSTYTSDPNPGGAAGVGGTYNFPFLATQAGVTTLSFGYGQPWDPSSFKQTFTVTIDVNPNANLVLTAQDNGHTVAAVVQQSIVVQLHGNPSTGYSWLLTSNGSSVSATGPSTYTPDPGGGIGGGGSFSFPFLAAKAGETTLSFSYARSWEAGSTIQTFTVTVRVTEQTPLPRVSILMKGTNTIVSWPIAGTTGFYLEGTRTLPSGWAALNALAVSDGSNYAVTLPPSEELLFFRLRQ